jgi:antitoxin component HigA of HigAB toxin-antitoxin module
MAVLSRLHVLHNVKEYDAAMEALDRLLALEPQRGTRDFELLELISLLVEDYESRNVPEPPMPSPAAVVEFMLEQRGLTRADLIEPLGGKSRVSEFLSGKRPLSTNQIKAVRDLLGVPADLLLEGNTPAVSGLKVSVVSLTYKQSQYSTREGAMAKKGPSVHVVKSQTQPGKFVAKLEGKSKPITRPATQEKTIQKAIPVAKKNQSEVVIHGRDGKIRDKDSYGNDPHPPRDKKH